MKISVLAFSFSLPFASAALAAVNVTPENFVLSLEGAKAGEELKLAAGTYELKQGVRVGVPLTLVGESDVVIYTAGGPVGRTGEYDVTNLLTFAEKVTARNIRFAGSTVGGCRVSGGGASWGGGVVRLEGAAAGSVFEDCEWSGNLIRLSSSGCYQRYGKTAMNRPKAELSLGATAGALVIDLADAEGAVTLRNCTFAYNVTTFGWTAGLNVTSGRVAVDGATFWGNVIAPRWCQYADLFVGYRGRVRLADATFAALGGRYFDDNDPKTVLEGVRIGDPKFETTKEEFLSKYLSVAPGILTLNAENFPFADVNDGEFNDCSAADRAKVHLGVTAEPRTALKVKPTEKLPFVRLEPNAFAGWTRLKPGPVIAGRFGGKLNWTVHYEKLEGSKHSAGAQSANGRTIRWYRHEDDPAWGRTYDNELGRDRKLTDDWFGVMKPADGDRPGRPLVVALHGRGGGFKGFNCIALGSEDSVFNVPTNSYGLTLDCRENALNDFWWGAMPPATKEAGMKVGGRKAPYNNGYYSFIGGATMYGELNIGPSLEPFKYHTMSCLEWCHKGEPPAMKRVLDTVEWAVRKFAIDRNRIYLVGNSMGGQAALAIGMRHGEVFAAVNANVPATVVYPASQMGFIDEKGADVAAASFAAPEADPPVVVDWSGSDDAWSRDHDILYRNMNRFKFAYVGWWGPYGHCGSLAKAREKNPGVCSFDIFSVKRNEAYPVFTDSDANSALPWPQKSWLAADGSGGKSVGGVETAKGTITPREGSDVVGQWNGHFRWQVVEDTPASFGIRLWTDDGKDATADVSMRRLQKFVLAKGGTWSYEGGGKGSLDYDAKLRTATVPRLKIGGEPKVLSFKK